MPFEKGRPKTGGRQKGITNRRSTRFVDQLKDNGFNFVKELAECLKAQPFTLSTKYLELKTLLPYMAPRLREKDVALSDPVDAPPVNPTAITDEALLRTFENGESKQPDPRASRPTSVAKGNPKLQAAPGAKADLSYLADEQEDH